MADQATAASTAYCEITEDALDAAAVARISDLVANEQAGAVVLFLGNVRNHHQGRSVEGITYSAYVSMAEERLNRIVNEISTGSLAVAIAHRIGKLEVGEASVLIATASAHREEAYRASRTALERLKAEVPIWKREHYRDGESEWREEEALS